MSHLLDTAALLWFYDEPEKLTKAAHDAIVDAGNQVFVSPASYWEVGIKISRKGLQLKESFADFIQHAVVDNGFIVLPILPTHAEKVSILPFHHKDPFDRMLAAQCLVEGMKIVSPDTLLDLYGIDRIW